MGEYVGLDGVRGGRIKPRGSHMAKSVSGLMYILNNGGRVCSASGDHGALTVWRTDNGVYRCNFSRYKNTIGDATCETKAGVRRWLKDWLPKCHHRPE